MSGPLIEALLSMCECCDNGCDCGCILDCPRHAHTAQTDGDQR